MMSLALAAAGPLLLTTRSAIGLGESVSALALLPGVGSGVALAMVAVLVRLPRTLELTWMTRVIPCAGAPATSVGRVAVIVPLAPTAVASVRVQPAGKASDTKVVPAGNGSLRSSVWASLGPVLLTVTV